MTEDGLHIRPAAPGDAAALLRIYAPYVRETAVTFEYDVPTREEFAARIAGTLTRYPCLVAERDGQPAGYAYAGAFKARPAYDWAVETTVYVDRAQRRGGVGRRLYGALERALSAQGILNLNACIACPAEEPDPYLTGDSAAFHRRMGYRLAGRFTQCGFKFGRWYDMIWMERLIGPHTSSAPPVRPFSPELAGTLE